MTATLPMASATDIVQLLSPQALGLDAERWGVGRETVIPVTGERADFAVFGAETWLIESHGARTLQGLRERILQRFCCLAAAITLNHQLGRNSRALVNYCA